jgi:hypothetical protein
MMVVLLLAGIGLLLAGLLTVGLGIQMDLSFGNTLILSGAIAACTGMIMLSLWAVARELKKIALRLGASLAVESRAEAAAAPNQQRHQATENGGSISRDQRGLDLDELEAAMQPSAPWQGDPPARDRGRNEAPPALPEPVEAAPAAKSRRNLMFSSSSGKERAPAQGRPPEPSMVDLLGPAPPPLQSIDAPPALPPALFDDTWPTPERARAPDAPPQRRGGRAPSTSAAANAGAAGADRYAPAGRNEGRTGVKILKSGVVDGMAYSLYSDGSIEAQMPEGMMRFSSIDELRSHLDQRA